MEPAQHIATLELMLSNLRSDVTRLEKQQERYEQILALAKEANVVLTSALKFYSGDEQAAQALAKYEQIKKRAVA